MARRLGMATRDELLAAIRSRYGEASWAEKARILDELVAVSGCHRKHPIRLVGSLPKPRRPPRPARRHYAEAARDALIALREASDRICSKRLKPLIPALLPAVERHGRMTLDDELRLRLLAVSPATMDRCGQMCGWWPAADSAGGPGSARPYAAPSRYARSATGTTRHPSTPRSISSPTPAPRPPAPSCGRWC
jgi:hypothetical protein